MLFSERAKKSTRSNGPFGRPVRTAAGTHYPFERAVRTGAKKHPFERAVQTARSNG